ncbi:hypothetical protein BGK67_17925 [Streptomyces subrutilus]|uniref:Peptidase S1 domain-containing protein n=1 Tax=Streptomyces subrutilus TaxID=36818 RepID=A0A1E5PTT5_9ACTN|nr:hypothetical protein BGK67_17925 [Streptomyces subrutilus]
MTTFGVAYVGPQAAAATEMPVAVEDFAYPDAAKIQAEQKILLKRGDGHITLVDCAAGTPDILVKSRAGLKNYCFDVNAPKGFVTLEIPSAFGIWTEDFPVKATITTDGTDKTVVDAPANDYKPFGEAGDSGAPSILVELRVTGEDVNPPAPSGDMTLAFTGKLTIGDSKRSCTAALVDPYWVLTAKHCFADNPADTSTVTAGAPKDKTTATVGRTDLATSGGHTTEISQIVPHADRDLVMARLAKPATAVAPVPLSSAAPTAGEALTAVGFGRTRTEWVPSKLHSATFTVGTLTPTSFPMTAKAPADATICQGDAGGPAVRTENGKPALVGITGRSSQGGCLGSGTTTTGASDIRIDGAQNWVKQVRFTTASIKNVNSNRCLYVPWQTAGNDAVVKQYDCAPEYADQLWKVEPVAGGNYQIRNVNSNRCLWVPWQTAGNDAVVKQYDCAPGYADQHWKVEPVAGGNYQIRNVNSNRCLWVPWQTAGNDAVVKQYDCDSRYADQLWKL